MKLGLISDTHDRVPMVEKAVAVFEREDIDLALHAGDYVAPFALKPFFAAELDFLGVWGNNDGDKLAVQKMAQGRIFDSPYIMTHGDKKILLGHYFETLDALIASQEFFMIVYGHTHRPEMRKEGRTLVVNPGECCGWVNGKSTVAVADLETQTAEIIDLS